MLYCDSEQFVLEPDHFHHHAVQHPFDMYVIRMLSHVGGDGGGGQDDGGQGNGGGVNGDGDTGGDGDAGTITGATLSLMRGAKPVFEPFASKHGHHKS